MSIYTVNQTWSAWNISYQCASNASSVYTSATIWTHWNYAFAGVNCTTYGGIANAANAWPEWMDRIEVHRIGLPARPSDEEVRRRLAHEQQLIKQEQERLAKLKRADERAYKLLRSCLSQAQIESLETRGFFYVEIDGGKERYRIDRGSHGNVKQVDKKGSIIRSFCIQPEGVPIGDVLLTQKLWLEASEETRAKFWETANITSLMQDKAVPAHIPRHERRKYAAEHGLLH